MNTKDITIDVSVKTIKISIKSSELIDSAGSHCNNVNVNIHNAISEIVNEYVNILNNKYILIFIFLIFTNYFTIY